MGGPSRQPARVYAKRTARAAVFRKVEARTSPPRSRDSTVSRSREVSYLSARQRCDSHNRTPRDSQHMASQRREALQSQHFTAEAPHFCSLRQNSYHGKPTEGKHCKTSLHLRENVKAKHGVG